MAVKLVGPAVSAEDEATALTAFRGRGAVELLDADLEVRVLLLEWLDQLHHQHEVAQRAGAAVPDAAFRRAVETVSELGRAGAGNLTHGDLSLPNIMPGARGWVALDPLLLAGTAAWEAHTVVRSHLPEIVDADDPVSVSARWTHVFADAAGLDRHEAGSLSFARFVASYYWESQNSGDPATVDDLRRIATAEGRR